TSYSLKLTLPLLSTLHLFYAPSTSPIYTLSLHDALPIYGDFIGDNILIAVGDIAEFGDLTIRDGHANLLIAVTNIEVPNTRRKLLKIKLRGNGRTGNGYVILTANRPQHVSVRRLDERERERRAGVGLKVLNDPTAPRLNLVRRLLISFGETVFRNEPIIR